MQTAKNTIWIHFKDCNKMQASFSLCEKPQVLGQLKERLGKRLYISPEMFTLGNMKGLAGFFFLKKKNQHLQVKCTRRMALREAQGH